MDKVSGTFTLLFENPFWIGVFENECGKNYEVARVVFGVEPTDAQLYEFILKLYYFDEIKTLSLEIKGEAHYGNIRPRNIHGCSILKFQCQSNGIKSL